MTPTLLRLDFSTISPNEKPVAWCGTKCRHGKFCFPRRIFVDFLTDFSKLYLLYWGFRQTAWQGWARTMNAPPSRTLGQILRHRRCPTWNTKNTGNTRNTRDTLWNTNNIFFQCCMNWKCLKYPKTCHWNIPLKEPATKENNRLTRTPK